jgi:hypothetical protein
MDLVTIDTFIYYFYKKTGVDYCTYSNMHFTDVDQPGFKQKLPMLLDDFVSHVEGHSKDIRDALLGNYGKLNVLYCVKI